MKLSVTEKNGKKGERSTHRLEEDVPMGDEFILLFVRMSEREREKRMSCGLKFRFTPR